MTMQRRDFLVGTAIVVSAPALGCLASLAPSLGRSDKQARMLPEALQPQVAGAGVKSHGGVIKIHGWQIESPTDDEVFLSINQSWRANWR
jgi:hypothetical protein